MHRNNFKIVLQTWEVSTISKSGKVGVVGGTFKILKSLLLLIISMISIEAENYVVILKASQNTSNVQRSACKNYTTVKIKSSLGFFFFDEQEFFGTNVTSQFIQARCRLVMNYLVGTRKMNYMWHFCLNMILKDNNCLIVNEYSDASLWCVYAYV